MLLCPSMMCADFGYLAEETKKLDAAGADIFHCDIMDGLFVPNMALGPSDIRAIRAHTNKPIDAHLMIENPANKVDWFIDSGADIIYIHPESERYTGKTLMHIKNRGVQAGIAINPDTPLTAVSELIPLCDYVMIMTVHPGFAGQRFVESTKEKIKALATCKETYGFQLMIDGACSPDVIREQSAASVDGFVLGTSALFGKGRPYQDILCDLRG